MSSKKETSSSKKISFLSVIICCVLIPVFTLLWIFYGPFETARRVWICTAMSTANHKYLATAFFSEQTINKYYNDFFDTIPEQDKNTVNPQKNKGEITVENVYIGLSRGKLMRIPDASRIDVSVCDYIGNSGMTLDNLILQEKAVAGINAGAYADKDGSSKGSVPDGVIIQNGEIIYMSNDNDEEFCVIGFDNENRLITAYAKNRKEINTMGLRCGISFGPPLIINGKGIIEKSGTSLQPRTAIAQCEDGSVLLLVLDGRQANSAGATLKNVQDLLLSEGAVVAANLDGGSSTAMIYNEQLLNNPSDNGKLKRIPTAFIVKGW